MQTCLKFVNYIKNRVIHQKHMHRTKRQRGFLWLTFYPKVSVASNLPCRQRESCRFILQWVKSPQWYSGSKMPLKRSAMVMVSCGMRMCMGKEGKMSFGGSYKTVTLQCNLSLNKKDLFTFLSLKHAMAKSVPQERRVRSLLLQQQHTKEKRFFFSTWQCY